MTTLSEPITPTTPALPAAPKTTMTRYVSANGNDLHDGLTPATAWRTPKGLESGTKMLLQGGLTPVYNTAGLSVIKLTDVEVGAYYQTSEGVIETAIVGASLPTLFADDGVNLFSFSNETQRVLIANVLCDSNFDIARTAGNYAYRAPKANWGNVRGSDIAIINNQLASLAEGIELDSCQRVLVQAVAQVQPLGMPSRCVYIQDAADLTLVGCSFVNSIGESPLRVTGLGVTRGLFAGNTISQLLDAAHGRASAKAAVTIRQAAGLLWNNNTVINGELSFTSDHTNHQLVSDVQINGGTVTGSLLNFSLGVTNTQINGLVIVNHTGSECVSDGAGEAGLAYNDCQFSGDDAGIKFYAASNAVVTGLKWNPSKPGLPAMKASGGVSMAGVVSK